MNRIEKCDIYTYLCLYLYSVSINVLYDMYTHWNITQPLKIKKQFFWLCWVFVTVCRFSLIAESRGYSLIAVSGLLFAVASLVTEHGL